MEGEPSGELSYGGDAALVESVEITWPQLRRWAGKSGLEGELMEEEEEETGMNWQCDR